MVYLLVLLFFLSAFGLLHTYLFYPFYLKFVTRGKSLSTPFLSETELPFVSVIMSVYNEEQVIQQKLDCLQKLDYPPHKINFFIGSDCSNDNTNGILEKIIANNFFVEFYGERTGKPGVVNRLVVKALNEKKADSEHIFLFTDANVILPPNLPRQLVRHFTNSKMALVDAHMVGTGSSVEDISESEGVYLNREVMLKHRESLHWQRMIGPFGGCFCLRSTFFTPIPENHLVDDFYLAMRAFERKGLAINDLEAKCFEALSQEIDQEFRRKARISAGNIQNMRTFWRLWFPPFGKLNFAFFSHKILRWLGPWLLITMLLTSGILAFGGFGESLNYIFRGLFFLQIIGLMLLPALDYLLQSCRINILYLRHLRYFVWMNVALLFGYFRYWSGIRSGVWEPPRRVL